MNKEKEAFIYDKCARAFILELYNKYKEDMLKLAFSKLNDWHEAEDAVEEAFINIANSYRNIIDSESYEIKKYIIITVTNMSYNILNKRNRNIYSDVNIIEEYSPPCNSAEEIAISEISYDELMHSIDILNPRQRQILNMKYMGYSNKEIAEKLNVKTDTIRVMLVRIRNILKKSKEGSLNDEGQK
jgi:RNA polymerase sigma-70 factor (ECF subfamily)